MSAAEAMTPPAAQSRRPEKELLIASKAFAVENRARSWAYTLSSFALMFALAAAAILSPWWPLSVAIAMFNGLVIVRVFCIFHDFQHGAILRQSKPAQVLFWLFGEAILCPPSVWRESHNYHHAHTAKIVGSHIGSYPVLTTRMYKDLPKKVQFMYRATRHPVNIFFALITVFGLGMCLSPFMRAPRKHWGALLSLLLVCGSGLACALTGHFTAFAFAWLIPFWVAAMSGSYLFYAQHNFPEAHIASRQDWTFSGAALESSSYMVMGPLMNWLTANIGFHHVHHLNAAIPFYRLPEAMETIPELQHPGKTSLSPKDISAAFAINLWDPEQNKMVPYPRA